MLIFYPSRQKAITLSHAGEYTHLQTGRGLVAIVSGGIHGLYATTNATWALTCWRRLGENRHQTAAPLR